MSRYPLLDTIHTVEDYRRIPQDMLPTLAAQLRSCMVETVAGTGGHLASGLGAVEIILAMHRVFTSPHDKMVFDVGHQAYAHKLITGRREAFDTLRQDGGISGFPKREESVHDHFNTGHATTSVSAALGMARAMALNGEDGTAVALIGDGAMTGGMAFEALNDAGQADVPLVVILNDNEMSISENNGALHRQLTNMRTSRSYVRFKRRLVRVLDTGRFGRLLSKRMKNFKNRIKNFLLPNQLFEEMGFTYFGPVDGHDIDRLVRIFGRARDMRIPVIVHCVTQKGKGYRFSEDDPEKFHGIAPFSVETGAVDAVEGIVRKSNSAVFGDALMRLAEQDERIVAVTAAMKCGTGLKDFAARFPERFFDVCIAEQHAVTMAAGMAAEGLRPVVAIYSTFLQRAYDQVLHDICLMNLPVVLAVDRAGLVGDDGETHQGQYDAAFLADMPNMTVYSPATQQELVHMLSLAVQNGTPAAIRYNRGYLMQAVSGMPVACGRWETLSPIAETTVIATGPMVELALRAIQTCPAGLINARTMHPLDEELLDAVGQTAKRVIVIEDSVDCLGRAVAVRLPKREVIRLHLPNAPIPQASVAKQRARYGLTEAHLEALIRGDA